MTLRWDPPEDETSYLEAYAAMDPRLTPQSKYPYRRGVARLPDLPYAYADKVLVPAGKSSFLYEDGMKPYRGYSSILGALVQAYFPGIVTLPNGQEDVAWTWKHYHYALDPTKKYNHMAEKIQVLSWNYFDMHRENSTECIAIVNELAKRKVQDMHYEARVKSVRNWFGDRKIWMNKSQARDMLFEPWQYLQNPPQFVGNDARCYTAMVAWWTHVEYLKRHEAAKKRREEMKGGSHRQGSIPLALVRQKEKVKTGVEPSMFAISKKMRTLDEPVNGSPWINEGAKIRGTKYPEKYKQVHGEDSNPDTAPFDPEVAVLAGQG
uniref:Uncharacterized protein n=1 Tax=Avena sativa TaxID=4498 RepID=A0ACD5ZY34_AVESA